MTKAHHKAFDEALRWVVRLDADDVTHDEKQRFLQWLDREPQHRELFDEAETLWSGFSALDQESLRDLQSYAYLPLSPWHPDRVWTWLKAFRAQRPSFATWGAAAAMALAMVIGVMWWQHYISPPPEVYETAAGEQKSITLADGTNIHLNTKSRLVVRMHKSSRSVDITEGEALFEVARRPDWPFEVETGNGSIRVLGTRFNVFKEPSHQVTVTVLSGEVEVVDDLDPKDAGKVWRRNLIKGQKVAYSDEGVVVEVSPADVAAATNWRRGVVVFEDATLVDAIAEFNRYSSRRIVLLDPSLGDMRIGGVFKITDISSAVRSLESAVPIEVVSRESFIGLTSRE